MTINFKERANFIWNIVDLLRGDYKQSEYRVRELIREKQIRATKIGQWRIKLQDLKEFVKGRTNK